MIQKAATGITGLDELTGGGLPRGRVTLVEGGVGTGKTLMALQSLVNAARELNEPGVFVAFEEHSDRIKVNAGGFGWRLDELPESKLTFVNCQPSVDIVQSGSFDLGGLLAGLGAIVDKIGAKRVVLDAVDMLLALLPGRRDVRREVYRLHEWLLERELTAIVTAKRQHRGQIALETDLDFMEYMVDSAVRLRQEVIEGISQRSLRILKYRGSAFDENDVPYVIGPQGLELAAGFNEDAPPLSVTHERVSTGVPRLDKMLDGGYYRGAAILVTGAPGTAKTTLAGAFAEAACGRGERTLLVSFDSRVEEISRNLGSVGIDLQTPLDQGLLRMESAGGLSGSSEIQLMRIRKWAQEHDARCIAIDPASALARPGNIMQAHSVVKRLVDWCKVHGITLLTTSLLERATENEARTPLHISTIADTWIHLEYRADSGERNRGLSIIKSRGTSHSNQIRELILSADGVELTDVYAAGGEVLMGTMRMERERAEAAVRRKTAREHRRQLLRLEAESNELEQGVRALQGSLRGKEEERQDAQESYQSVDQLLSDTDDLIRHKRHADTGSNTTDSNESDNNRSSSTKSGDDD